MTDPPLTTVRQNIEKMAPLLLRTLEPPADALGAPALSSVVTPTRLVVRASA